MILQCNVCDGIGANSGDGNDDEDAGDKADNSFGKYTALLDLLHNCLQLSQ